MLTFFTYLLALLMGIMLGITGGGGSALTVPVLRYLAGISPVEATGYSLFIVGITALAGAVNYGIRKQIHYKAALLFAFPSFIAVFITRKYMMPGLPDIFFSVGNWIITKNIALMILFALLMGFTAFSMIANRRRKEADESRPVEFHYSLIATQGFGIGILTGLLGAGGGFIIVPALVLLANLPIRLAVGTSLMIIAINSFFGFMGDLMNKASIDWHFLMIFSFISVTGVFVGSYFSQFIPAKKLKVGFGYFLLVIAVFILTKEIFL
jgi:hypothetical protein